MIAMQYKIKLPEDYNMDIIRKRVLNNGHKTDGFQDLLFKAYLISESNGMAEYSNEYSPLYLWKNNEGMNKFVFNGFYDNILKSFGWQKINIGIPFLLEMNKNFSKSKFVLEIEKEIPEMQKMEPLKFSMDLSEYTGRVLIYNPDKWRYVEYYFCETIPDHISTVKIYEILHLSM